MYCLYGVVKKLYSRSLVLSFRLLCCLILISQGIVIELTKVNKHSRLVLSYCHHNHGSKISYSLSLSSASSSSYFVMSTLGH